jgi:hypothetical protein
MTLNIFQTRSLTFDVVLLLEDRSRVTKSCQEQLGSDLGISWTCKIFVNIVHWMNGEFDDITK